MTLILHCKVIQGQASFCVINISLEALKVHFTSVSFKTVDDYLYFIIDQHTNIASFSGNYTTIAQRQDL